MTKPEFKHKVFVLSERIYPLVARMLGTAHAEDAIQEIMLKLWEKRKEIEKHPNITGLVFLTARNYCIDVIRKKKNTVSYESSHLKIAHATKEQSKVEWKELKNIVDNILESLPNQQQEVFKMRDIDGYETSEIAAALTLKVEHVRVLLSRARKQIGKVLSTKYNYERGAY